MKILVLSDSHGKVGKMKRMITERKNLDAIIYLGDGEKDFDKVLSEIELPENIVTYKVRGNCDKNSSAAVTLVENIGGVKFYITHGYEQGVKYGLEKLAELAAEEQCEIALFGHVHRQYRSEIGIESGQMVFVFNPGSVANGEYGIIKIKDGELKYKLKTLKND